MFTTYSTQNIAAVKNFLKLLCNGRRYISSHYVRPRPRSYKRRLFEAALTPILPKEMALEWKKLNDPYNIHSISPAPQEQYNDNEFTLYELALVDKLKHWINKEHYRTMAICQLNYINDDTFWLAKNQFRIDGLEICDEQCKIMHKLFESTPFRVLNHLFVDDCTSILFGRDIEAIGAIIKQCNQFSWIQPLVITFDDRVLLMDQARELAALESEQKLRMEAMQIIENFSRQITNNLDRIIKQIPESLDLHLNAHDQNC